MVRYVARDARPLSAIILPMPFHYTYPASDHEPTGRFIRDRDREQTPWSGALIAMPGCGPPTSLAASLRTSISSRGGAGHFAAS
jgi:hypothetical protein